MSSPPLLPILITLGRTGLPEIVISGFILRFAYVQHSTALTFLAVFLLWPGLAHLHACYFSKRRPPKE
jgi:hypothetical protein